MEYLSVLMIAFIAILLCVAVPRMFADWLSFQNMAQTDEFDEFQTMMVSANLWAQRHFWCALLAICMVMVIDNSALEAKSPHLLQMTTVYAGISILFAFAESLFAQKIAVLLSSRRVMIRDREKETQ